MRERMSGLLEVPVSEVSVKATTAEGLGALGRGEGMSCVAVVTLIPGEAR
jgi:2-C-methyl-D-erythritol 2,4-cyclodiphosphate synthase